MKKWFLFSGSIVIALFLTVSCSDEKDKSQHLCFYNGSGQTAQGIAWRPAGTTTWSYSYFDAPVYNGDGFDYEEGKFDEHVDAGNYDIMIFNTSIVRIRQWNNFYFNGKALGIQCTNSLSTSIIGAVDKDCNPTGATYTADL